LTGTGLEDVPEEGQSVHGGLTANNIRNKVADYFLTDAGAFWSILYLNTMSKHDKDERDALKPWTIPADVLSSIQEHITYNVYHLGMVPNYYPTYYQPMCFSKQYKPGLSPQLHFPGRTFTLWSAVL